MLLDVFLNALPIESTIKSVVELIDSNKYDIYRGSTESWGDTYLC
jgi:hypothetical protein